ncbi:hypothetical protein FACS1894211_02520 [Clostridia bacterium]|nr:hypothetical protein FACS1894211_02520 [Clostridia bacterium]
MSKRNNDSSFVARETVKPLNPRKAGREFRKQAKANRSSDYGYAKYTVRQVWVDRRNPDDQDLL